MKRYGGFNIGNRISLYLPPDKGNQVLTKMLKKKEPFISARYGRFELLTVAGQYLGEEAIVQKTLFNLCNNAGFFPMNKELIHKFTEVYLESTKKIDFFSATHYRHGLWHYEECIFKNFCPKAILSDIQVMNFYKFDKPWTYQLKNKKVLVIHPFVGSIRDQYNLHRDSLFLDKKILPEFKSLSLVKAVQSIAAQKTPFNDWFEALDFMCRQIDKTDFEIAIIGAGAYGIPLAAHVKSLGKQAIHMGGVTQILFGIKGKRWDGKLSNLYNKYWVRPSEVERPRLSHKVENGAYW